MKAAILIILALMVTIAFVAQPETPKYTCTVLNKDLSKLCLSYIPKYYDADFLTYEGHTRAWIYRRLNKFGIDLGKQRTKYLSNYSYLEDAVNCHVTASGDASLNMTKTPVEFDATYKLISKNH